MPKRVVNLPNMHREYASGGLLGHAQGFCGNTKQCWRRNRRRRAQSLEPRPEKPCFPTLRSRYDRTVIDIQLLTGDKTFFLPAQRSAT